MKLQKEFLHTVKLEESYLLYLPQLSSKAVVVCRCHKSRWKCTKENVEIKQTLYQTHNEACKIQQQGKQNKGLSKRQTCCFFVLDLNKL